MRSPSLGLSAGRLPERSSMWASMAGDSGEVCSTIKSDAGKSEGNPPASTRNASMPPAEAPITMISFAMKRSLQRRGYVLQVFDEGVKYNTLIARPAVRITQSKIDHHTRRITFLISDWAP